MRNKIIAVNAVIVLIVGLLAFAIVRTQLALTTSSPEQLKKSAQRDAALHRSVDQRVDEGDGTARGELGDRHAFRADVGIGVDIPLFAAQIAQPCYELGIVDP